MMPDFKKGGKLFTFFCLYIAQSIPMSFFSTIIPVIMRQNNFSLEVIGMLQFVKLPWILKFLWSPAVDRTCFRLKDYKTWIFSSEMIYAVIILAISFMSFNITPALIIGLIICAFIASATQDIATDALAVISFRREDKSLVNSMQSMGSFAGAMIGAGLLLLLYDTLGWNNLLPFLALFVIVAVIPLIFYSRKQIEAPLEEKTVSKAHPNDLLGFFKQKGIWKQIPFLFLYYMGLIGTLAMLKPMLVDFGYDLRDIGVISGVIGTSIGCAGSLAGGFIVKKIGRNASRILFAVCILISAIYFYSLLAFLPFNIATLHLGVSLLWLSYGMSTIIVYTTAMDCVRKGYEGTDFTVQTVITHLSGMIMAVVSGTIAKESGYRNLFLVEAGIALVSLIYILFIFKARKGKADESGTA